MQNRSWPVAVASNLLLMYLCCIIHGTGSGLHSTVCVSLPYCTQPVDATFILLLAYLCYIIYSQWRLPAFYCRCFFAVSYTTRGCCLHSTVVVSLLYHTQPGVVACILPLVYLFCILYRQCRWPELYCLCIPDMENFTDAAGTPVKNLFWVGNMYTDHIVFLFEFGLVSVQFLVVGLPTHIKIKPLCLLHLMLYST